MTTETTIGIVSAAIAIGAVLIVRFARDRWAEWLTLEEYWQAHPGCRSENGAKCFKCNSLDIAQRGWKNASDVRRVHICNHCNTPLYRSGMPIGWTS